MKFAALTAVAASPAMAWPGMRRQTAAAEDYIGPPCTVGAHNWHPESGPCPNTEQPEPPAPYSGMRHAWPAQFTVQWEFYFVPDDSDEPPYDPLPTTPYNVTTGRTYYYNNEETGVRNMKEVYDEYCIPVFGSPLSPMGRGNQYSCDFLNIGATNTSYVVLHEDRPPHTPECCIIGRPFHAPPQDFADLMPVHWTDKVGAVTVDWNAVEDKDAGIFNYGFISDDRSIPYAFYMKGIPWIANWMWQAFRDFKEEEPPQSVWEIPAACAVTVDWNAVEDKDAGIFNYGFISDDRSIPYAFYMKGIPWIANWMWQAFRDFKEEEPPQSVWEIPAACAAAEACPGW